MDSKDIKSILQDALEDEVPASQINLLSAIQSQLVAGTKSNHQQGERMSQTRTKRLTSLVITFIVVLTVVLSTPQGRAFAQSVLKFFNRAESYEFTLESEQIASPRDVQDMATANPPIPLVSFEEAQQTAGFNVKELPAAPKGFTFTGAMATEGSVVIEYQALGNGGQLIINESTNGFMQSDWDRAPAEAITRVTVNGLDAEIVQGAYVVYPGGTSAKWNRDAPILRLRWVTDGIWYEMAKFGNVESIEYLDQNGLIELAESLQ